ncbi:MAG: DNA-3-methyladenine glycosylase I [Hyphomonas sp.]
MTETCGWAPANDALYRAYHDTEWGVPEYDGRALREKLQLDGMQAGLSWITILRKRDSIRRNSTGSIRISSPDGRRNAPKRR